MVPASTAFCELVMLTSAPPAGAGPLRVTVAVVELPPTTTVGDSVIPVTVGGVPELDEFTVKGAVAVPPFADAVRFTVVFAVTEFVGIEKEPLDDPAVMVNVLFATTAVFELVSVTFTPPAGAAAVRVTVAVVGLPPVTVVGERDSRITAAPDGGFTTRTAICQLPLSKAYT